MANPQPDQFTKLSNELYEAIMKTDFSKRQRNVLDLVIRLSYGCRKKTAILRPSDFEVVGVGRNHVKNELEYLQMANVLHIEGEVFSLNKDYDTWRVSITKMFNNEKFSKILSRNLNQTIPESGTKVPETGIRVPETGTADEEKGVPETGTFIPETGTRIPEMGTFFEIDFDEEFPKREQGSSQNGNSTVPKTGIGTTDEALQDAGSRVPKDSIKDSIKDSSSTSMEEHRAFEETAATAAETRGPIDFSFKTLFKIYEEHFTDDGKVNEFEAQDLGYLFDDYGGEWLYEGMRECGRHRIMTMPYLRSVMRGFAERGGPDVPKQKSDKSSYQSVNGGSPASRGVSDVEETRKEIEARRELERRAAEERRQRLLAAAGP